jgi:hypothetical protein
MRDQILTTSYWLHVELGKNIKKIICQKQFKKKNVMLFFDLEFFKYFFRVLHEASRSWLKFGHTFQ